MRAIFVGLWLALLLLLVPAHASAHEAPNVVAIGSGLDSGLIGFKYQRVLADGALTAGVGAGIAFGISPTLQWNFYQFGNWSLNVGAGLMYTPIEGVLFSQHAIVGFASAGIQRWAWRTDGLGLYLDAGLDLGYLLHGDAEGGDDELLPVPRLHLGLSF